MRQLVKILFAIAAISVSPLQADTIELKAIDDFPQITSGEVPYYKDVVGSLNVLAIDAANVSYRDKFARADHTFASADGIYDLAINALGEIDGDCEYRLLVNGSLIGTAVNAPASEDYAVQIHTFKSVALSGGDIISVESKAVSNGQIPEGEAFAFARGRWRSLTLTSNDDSSDSSLSTNLKLLTNTSVSVLETGNKATINALLTNISDTAATSSVLEALLPADLQFVSSSACTVQQTTLRCELGEVSPGNSISAAVELMPVAAGDYNFDLIAKSDQSDSDTSDNKRTITLSVSTNTDQGSTAGSTDSGDGAIDTERDNSGNGGAISWQWFLMLLSFYPVRRRIARISKS